MSIKVQCKCGKEYNLADKYLGKTATCKVCGNKFKVSKIVEEKQNPSSPVDFNIAKNKLKGAYVSFKNLLKGISRLDYEVLISYVALNIITVILVYFRSAIGYNNADVILNMIYLTALIVYLIFRIYKLSFKELIAPLAVISLSVLIIIINGILTWYYLHANPENSIPAYVEFLADKILYTLSDLAAIVICSVLVIWFFYIWYKSSQRKVKTVVLGIVGVLAISIINLTASEFVFIKVWDYSPFLTYEEKDLLEEMKSSEGKDFAIKCNAAYSACTGLWSYRIHDESYEFIDNYISSAFENRQLSEKLGNKYFLEKIQNEMESYNEEHPNNKFPDYCLSMLGTIIEASKHKYLSEEEATKSLKEYLAEWTIHKDPSIYDKKINVAAQILYQPAAYEITACLRQSSDCFKIKAILKFETNGGFLKPSVMTFEVEKANKISITSHDIPK